MAADLQWTSPLTRICRIHGPCWEFLTVSNKHTPSWSCLGAFVWDASNPILSLWYLFFHSIGFYEIIHNFPTVINWTSFTGKRPHGLQLGSWIRIRATCSFRKKSIRHLAALLIPFVSNARMNASKKLSLKTVVEGLSGALPQHVSPISQRSLHHPGHKRTICARGSRRDTPGTPIHKCPSTMTKLFNNPYFS